MCSPVSSIYLESCIKYVVMMFSCIQYKSRIMYTLCGHVFSCIQYKSRIMYKVCGHVFSCIQYKSRIMHKVCGHVFSCIQYKFIIMYKVFGDIANIFIWICMTTNQGDTNSRASFSVWMKYIFVFNQKQLALTSKLLPTTGMYSCFINQSSLLML